MARKSFKSGLGSLIKNSNIELEGSTESKSEGGDVEKLEFKISQLQEELKLWRTGKLTVDTFKKTLKENNLKYDDEKNEFSKIK